LNIQADAVTWVSDALNFRKNARKKRRSRKTPCRSPRYNKKKNRVSPAVRARWNWKLRVSKWLCGLFPVDCFVVEDVKATSFGNTKWNKTFSPLQTGKKRFYLELGNLAWVETLQGYETFTIRGQYGLEKATNKAESSFAAHCVDSWVLANWYTGGHTTPDNTNILFIKPLRFHRRQLQVRNPIKGGFRKKFGGTRSQGFKRGSIIRHKKRGIVYVGGAQKDRVSLYSLESGKRLCENAKPKECKFLAHNSWRFAHAG
jgi:hypothetical protein